LTHKLLLISFFASYSLIIRVVTLKKITLDKILKEKIGDA